MGTAKSKSVKIKRSETVTGLAYEIIHQKAPHKDRIVAFYYNDQRFCPGDIVQVKPNTSRKEYFTGKIIDINPEKEHEKAKPIVVIEDCDSKVQGRFAVVEIEKM